MVNTHKRSKWTRKIRGNVTDVKKLLCSALVDHYEYCKTAAALRQVQFNFLHHSAQGQFMCF